MIVKLGSLISEYSVRNKADEDIPVYSVTNEQGFCTGYFSKEVASQNRTTYKIVPRGCFAYNPSRINVGSVDVQECEDRVIVSPLYVVFSVDEKLNRRYLLHYLKSDITLTYIKAYASGSVRDNLKFSILKDFPINLPSAEEQGQIVATLDGIEHLIALRKEEIASLDELVKSRFIELFGDPVSNSMGLPTEPMTTVCAIIDGDRGKNYPKQDEFSDTGYCLFLNAKNVTATGFSFENRMFITKEKHDALHNGKLERGDVVLTTRGTLGNLAFYDDSVPFENVRINSGMVILRMKKSVMTEVFFMEQFKLQLQSIKGKIASGSAQPQLPISTMNKIRILLAPMALQEQFAAFVEQTDKSKLCGKLEVAA